MTSDRPTGNEHVTLLISPFDEPVVTALLHPLLVRLLAGGVEPVVRVGRGAPARDEASGTLSGIVVARVPDSRGGGEPIPDAAPRGALTLVVPSPSAQQPAFTHLGPDDAAGATAVVRHLAELGHRRFGYVSGPTQRLAHGVRAETFARVAADLVPDAPPVDVVVTQATLEDGVRAGLRLVAAGCTAVVADSDLLALGVVAAARDSGLTVPRDLSVIGNGDTVFVAQSDPPLTTVRHPFSRLVRTAVDLVVAARDDGIGDGAIDELLFRPELIIRRSSGAAPTGVVA